MMGYLQTLASNNQCSSVSLLTSPGVAWLCWAQLSWLQAYTQVLSTCFFTLLGKLLFGVPVVKWQEQKCMVPFRLWLEIGTLPFLLTSHWLKLVK